MGYLVLQGGSEFSGQMIHSDRQALKLAGGLDTPIHIIPAAAAPDNNHQRAGHHGRQWFHSLGARHVEVLPIVDRASANDPDLAARLDRSSLIYFLGGFPGHLVRTMARTLAWRAVKKALSRGAVVAGSSAGAMFFCEHVYHPDQKSVVAGLQLLPSCCVLPHHDTFGRQWASRLQKELPGATLIGIDEQTGAINDGTNGRWTVYGRGGVTLYLKQKIEHYSNGAAFHLPSIKEKS